MYNVGGRDGSGKHSFASLRNLHVRNRAGDLDGAVNGTGREVKFGGGCSEGFFGEGVEVAVLENRFGREVGVRGEGGVCVPRALARAGKSDLRKN